MNKTAITELRRILDVRTDVETEARQVQFNTSVILRNRREKAGVSLRTMAKRLKVSPPYLSDLERGRRNWSVEMVQRFEEGL